MGRRGRPPKVVDPADRTPSVPPASQDIAPQIIAQPRSQVSLVNDLIDAAFNKSALSSPLVASSGIDSATAAIVPPLGSPTVGSPAIGDNPRTNTVVPPVIPPPAGLSKPPTWRDRVMSRSQIGMDLRFIQGDANSDEVIIEESDIVDELAYWKLALVGNFLGLKPKLAQVQEFVNKHWNHVSRPEVIYFKKGWFYFRFSSEEDMCTILRGGNWSLGGKMLILKRWTPQFSQELDYTSTVPVWVILPDLDPQFWSPTALSKIASKIGVPLYADPVTTNKEKLSFARVMIEVDVSIKLPEHLLLHTPFSGKLLQRIEYEWVPFYCSHCKKLGHEKEKCRLFKKETVSPPSVSEPAIPVVSAPMGEADSSGVVTSEKPTQIHSSSVLPPASLVDRDKMVSGSTGTTPFISADGFTLVRSKKSWASKPPGSVGDPTNGLSTLVVQLHDIDAIDDAPPLCSP